jgi:hypothetical protein
MTFFAHRVTTYIGLAVLTAILIACGSSGDSKVDSSGAGGSETNAAADKGATSEGVYKFGQTIKFDDGSTLKVDKPTKFKPDKYAITGEKKKLYMKFKATFTNRTKEIYDPTLTTASASADGEEGESVFQDGLSTPTNKVLPGKAVSWWMGYGINSDKDLQLQLDIGFLDHDTVIFTA